MLACATLRRNMRGTLDAYLGYAPMLLHIGRTAPRQEAGMLRRRTTTVTDAPSRLADGDTVFAPGQTESIADMYRRAWATAPTQPRPALAAGAVHGREPRP